MAESAVERVVPAERGEWLPIAGRPGAKPAVSIILPTYNRAAFLPEALAAIRQQQWTDWELIVVDDGSTDATRQVVEQHTADWPQPVRYVYQENQGPAGARNTGLDLARGRYIAFYDSDDLWLEHHLRDCVEALEAHPEVDWVYGACRMVEHETGRELAPSTFYVQGRPRPFLNLRCRISGKLRIIDDRRAIRCMIRHGLYCGLQDSVIRRRLFEPCQFDVLSRVGEDQLLVIEALARGHRLAYLDQVHVVYRVHGGNSSATGRCDDPRRAERIHRTLIAGFERLAARGVLRGADQRALHRRIADEYFWHLGYSILWTQGQREEALRCFRRAIAWWPWNWKYYKTLALSLVRHWTPTWLKTAVWLATDRDWRRQFLDNVRRNRRYRKGQRRAVAFLRKTYGDRVLAGPFKGMLLPNVITQDANAHYLLGTYEKEIHGFLSAVLSRDYSSILDIGANVGYYACGLAKFFPKTTVIAYEMDFSYHTIIQDLVHVNECKNVVIRGKCDQGSLLGDLQSGGRLLIVCDIDGGEEMLCDPEIVPRMKHCDLIIETHDHIAKDITDRLHALYQNSHNISICTRQDRTLNDLPEGIAMPRDLALAAMDEHRGVDQKWIFLSARQS